MRKRVRCLRDPRRLLWDLFAHAFVAGRALAVLLVLGHQLLATVAIASPASVDPLIQSAEFYFLNREYKSALQIWQRVHKTAPAHSRAALRVLELTLLVEGREALTEAAVAWLGTTDLTPELRKSGRDRLQVLQSTFLTDQGQTSFYQALPRLERADCSGALPHLELANQVEKGNTRVLREKALCERKNAAYGRMLDSLRAGHALNPYDRWFCEELAESEIFQGEYASLIQRFKAEPMNSLTEREHLAFAVALYERDDPDRARQVLAHLKESWGDQPPAIALFLWSSLDRLEGPRYLARFQAAAKKVSKDAWDPYRLQARVEAIPK